MYPLLPAGEAGCEWAAEGQETPFRWSASGKAPASQALLGARRESLYTRPLGTDCAWSVTAEPPDPFSPFLPHTLLVLPPSAPSFCVPSAANAFGAPFPSLPGPSELMAGGGPLCELRSVPCRGPAKRICPACLLRQARSQTPELGCRLPLPGGSQ